MFKSLTLEITLTFDKLRAVRNLILDVDLDVLERLLNFNLRTRISNVVTPRIIATEKKLGSVRMSRSLVDAVHNSNIQYVLTDLHSHRRVYYSYGQSVEWSFAQD